MKDIAFVLVSFMLLMSFTLATQIAMAQLTPFELGGEGESHVHRLITIMQMCNEHMDQDPLIAQPCKNIVSAFNWHMRQLFIEARNDTAIIFQSTQ